jgi:hypothetical protein
MWRYVRGRGRSLFSRNIAEVRPTVGTDNKFDEFEANFKRNKKIDKAYAIYRMTGDLMSVLQNRILRSFP